jgi:anti-sigma factor RsiW
VTDDENRAYLRRLVEDVIESRLRRIVAEEIEAANQRFFETGDDAAEMRRVKDAIRWAVKRQEASEETWKTATAEAIKLLLGAAAGAFAAYWSGVGHK